MVRAKILPKDHSSHKHATKKDHVMDETEYLMSSKVNRDRMLSALNSKEHTTYKNLDEFRRAYKIQ